ncbi:MAG: SIS domain-containing protein [Pseudomonadota bacterium]
MSVEKFFEHVATVARTIDVESIDSVIKGLRKVRDRKGRLFILGVGGSAGNAGHAVNDFRKLCGLETYAPTDNVSELTARTNDEGWETVFGEWLRTSNVRSDDAVLVFSVGGGDRSHNVSVNLINAIDVAREAGASVYGIVGKATGYTAQVADAVVVVPTPDPALVTPISEAFQAVVWHCMVSHPDLQVQQTKW